MVALGCHEFGGAPRARPGRLRSIAQLLIAGLVLAAMTGAREPVRSQTAPPSGASGDAASEARAAKARAVLEVHCARCHQYDKLSIPAPAANLGDVLDLDRLASDPSLVIPGNADASRLYTLVLRGEMPFTTPNNPGKDEAPTFADLDILRDWIEALPARAPCQAQQKPSRDSISREIARASDGDIRLVYLGHLNDACSGEVSLRGFRQAATKLLNSISSGDRPLRPEAIGEGGTILKLRLSDYGIAAEVWDAMVASNPLARAFDAGAKIVPADWLAARLAGSDIYYRLAGVPERLDSWLTTLGVDKSTAQPRRIALRSSAITRGNRIIERYSGRNGAVWLVYDFASSEGARDAFANPFGPQNAPSSSPPFKPDGIRVIAMRPNGFLTWAVFDPEGRRLDAVPADIEAGALFGGSVPAPGSCQSCHQGGPKPAIDELRTFATSPGSPLSKQIQDAILALHMTEAEASQAFAAELLRYRHALSAAGVDPDLQIHGTEIVSALATEHKRPVSMERGAAELALDRATWDTRLSTLNGEASFLVRRIRQTPIPREEVERLFDLLLPKYTPLADQSIGPEQPIRDIALVPDKLHYKSGDLATISVRAGFPCNLTLISINPAGKATVIFPNDFEPDNAMVSSKERVIPAPTAGYRLRLGEKGRERLVAICTAQSKLAEGIQQNYELQRFTALGDWRSFLRNLVDGVEPEASKTEKSEPARRGRSSTQRVRTKDADAPKRPRSEPQARAAIDITVE